MKTTQKQASQRLFKKLSALRATLSNDERAILDTIMGVQEASAQKLGGRVTGRAVSRVAGTKADMRVSFDENSEEYKILE